LEYLESNDIVIQGLYTSSYAMSDIGVTCYLYWWETLYTLSVSGHLILHHVYTTIGYFERSAESLSSCITTFQN